MTHGPTDTAPAVVTVVRERRASDAAGLVEALWRVHGSDGYPASWPEDPTAWLTPDGLVGAWFAVDEDERLVGHVGLTVPGTGRMPSVTRLFVDPAARGSGVADRLLDLAEAAVTGQHVRLDVTEDSPSAWRLYERRGWRLTGTGPADWAMPSGAVPTMRYYAKRLG